MQSMIRYFFSNSVEILFAVAIVLIGYSLVRRLNVRFWIAFPMALSPLLVVWAYQNALNGGVMMKFF
jgi:hypothetical protein